MTKEKTEVRQITKENYRNIKEAHIMEILYDFFDPLMENRGYTFRTIQGLLPLKLRDFSVDASIEGNNNLRSILNINIDNGLFLPSTHYDQNDKITSDAYRINPKKISEVEQILHDNAKLLTEF